MNALPDNVKQAIAGWLQSGEIELFIGYEASSLPLQATPAFVRKAEDLDRLIWDATCENNLVSFLKQFRGKKVGLMVKGCDARALVGLMREGQLVRDNLRIVGVCCLGVVDAKRVAAAAGQAVEELDGRVTGTDVLTADQHLALSSVMHATCAACRHHNPEIYDILIGEPVADADDDPFDDIRAVEALGSAERWARFEHELSKCNLCFACRNVCPFCYCNTCFADKTMPRWFTATAEPKDIQFYQIIRTFHLAGRCVGCNACSRACPQGVDLRTMLDKLRLDVWELYQDDAGVNPQGHPPLTTYREDDDNSFVL
ncbi:MAG: 4Fe-4S dicluster domain-containing protein [Chloroflexi bacterium]|nr:4Fe-4S dicluster domain-containing protein [Chloroflexota bacterium]